MSMTGCCIKLTSHINMTEFLVKKVAFNPPKKVTYSIKKSCKINNPNCKYFQCTSEFHDYKSSFPWIEYRTYEVKKPNNKFIIVLYIINKNTQKKSPTILFSHGNSCDLGSTFTFLVDFSTQLKMNIVSYDYSGYGHSEGVPSEEEINNDIEQVSIFMQKYLEIGKENTVLFGNSLGSVPSINIASSELNFNFSGLILLSPFSSGIRTLDSNLKFSNDEYEKYDVFNNIMKVRNVECPIFLIHGIKDEVFPCKQSFEMAKVIKCLYKWYPKNGNHNNIYKDYREKFITKTKIFIDHLKCMKEIKSLDFISDYKENRKENLVSKVNNVGCKSEYSIEDKTPYSHIGIIGMNAWSKGLSLNKFSKDGIEESKFEEENSGRDSVINMKNTREIEDQFILYKRMEGF